MKKLHYFAAACLLLASCSESGYVGDVLLDTQGTEEITFSQFVPNITRGSAEDASKLNNNFIVYGFKIASGDASGDAEKVDGSTDKTVFDLYNVNYVSGSANSTLSNTNGWEYVGNTSKKSATQTIKYWDYSAKEYIFSAVSCGSGDAIKVTKITDAATIAGTTVQEKGWQLAVPAGTTLDNLYASERKVMAKPTPAGTKYGVVSLTFYSLASKIRFAMYETVPGYSVKIDKCYYGSTNSTTNFAVDGTFKGMNGSLETKLIVTYNSSNVPILSYNSESTTEYMKFGGNLLSQTAIGTASNSPTYDKSAGAYSLILPYESKKESEASKQTNVLKIKLDYTLTSTDGSNEVIKVYGATAAIPTEYTQWKNNYAYTYIFKISDNTSGSTGGGDDPKGLYPITFDACVATTSDGTQETVTTVAEPSITTYQAGSTGSYTGGNITVSVYDETDKEVLLTKDSLKLYTAFSTDGTVISEKNVENYKKNGIVLTDVSATIAGYSSLNAKTATFNAVNNKTYVVEYTNKYYKVITVGTPATANYKYELYKEVGCTTNLTEIEEGGTFYVKVLENIHSDYPLTNAEKNFQTSTMNAFSIATTSTSGVYAFTAKGGTAGAYDILVKSAAGTAGSVTVKPFEFATGSVDVIADNSDEKTITLNFNGAAATSVDADTYFTVPANVSIEDVTDGVVKLKAKKTAQTGEITYMNNGIVVATATVNVLHYSFDVTTGHNVLNIGSVEAVDKTATLTMKLAGTPVTAATGITTTSTPAASVLSGTYPTVTDASGNVVLHAGTAPGTVTVKAPDNDSINIEVKNFAISVYTDAACTTEATTPLTAGNTYFVKFTNNGTAEYAAISASKGTLTKAAGTGVYQWVAPATSAGETTIKYTYKSVEFTLFKQTF